MIIYNFSLIIFFLTLFQFINYNTKTLYSLSDLGMTNSITKILSASLFSMAGIPPFWGFFSKIFIFLLLFNSSFVLYTSIFFTLLLVGLYFYIQNVRFFNATAKATINYPYELNLRAVPYYYYITYSIIFFLIFGFFFTEDLFVIVA